MLLYPVITLCGLCALSAMIVRIMVGIGRIDRPGPRSSHSVPTPKGGGVGILAAFAVGLVLLGAARGFSAVIVGLLVSSCGLAVVAYLDDLRDWPFWTKLAAQAGAACVAIGCGITLSALPLPWLGLTRLGLLGAPLAFCWLLFATNAMNFMDGLNGLAAGVTLIVCMAVACVVTSGAWMSPAGAAALCLAAGVLGFLPFNFPRARIFMGDVGSQLCGFGVASLGLLAAIPGSGSSVPWIVPMMLAGMLYDVAFTLLRRLARGERLTQAHRDHLYQAATRCGLSAPSVAVVHWTMAVWGALCAWLLSRQAVWAAPTSLVLLAAPQILWTAAILLMTRRARSCTMLRPAVTQTGSGVEPEHGKG